MIKAIALDFGGVLYEINQLNSYNAFLSYAKFNSNIYDLSPSFYNNIQFVNIYETGLVSDQKFRSTVRNFINNRSITDKEIDEAWNSTLIKLYDETPQLVKILAEKYQLFLLSNTNNIHYNYFYKQCEDVFKYFTKCFLSFQIKRRKPDNDFFEFVLKDINFKPSEILFIDDLQQNLDSSKKLGFNTLLKEPNILLSDLLHSVNII